MKKSKLAWVLNNKNGETNMTQNERKFVCILRETKAANINLSVMMDILSRFADSESSESIAKSYGIIKTAAGFEIE